MKWKYGFMITIAALVIGGMFVSSCGNDNVTNPSNRVSPSPSGSSSPSASPSESPTASPSESPSASPTPSASPSASPVAGTPPSANPGQFVIFTGTISDVGRATIVVDGITVFVDDQGRTTIRHAGQQDSLTIGDLAVGQSVRIKGVWGSDGTIAAQDIAIQP